MPASKGSGPRSAQTLLAARRDGRGRGPGPDRGGRRFHGEGLDSFEVVARLVDASLVQVRSVTGPTRYELLRTSPAWTLETSAALRVRRPERATRTRRSRPRGRARAHLAGAERSDTLRRSIARCPTCAPFSTR